jgi:RNA polymerase sigma-70 factor (ECF subfamily)
METNDQLLAEILENKDLDRLVELIYPKVRAYFQKRVFSVDICLDLTQETILRVCKSIEGLRGAQKFWGWLFRIASNLLYDWRQRKGSVFGAPLEDWEDLRGSLHSTDPSPEDATLRAERRQVLKTAIAELPGQMRRCTVLYIEHGLLYREIAELMNLSLGAVKAHLNQARKRLLKALREAFDAE